MFKRKSYISELNESKYLIEDLISEYNKKYSDISQEDFNKIIALDADSYPNQDTTKEPFKVGQIAGGNGILIKFYRKGDTSWLNDTEKCNKILEATKIFYKNRKEMPIKNPAQFESINQFLDMVLNGAAVTAVEEPKETEEEKALAKIEKLRLSQFPSLSSEIFLKLIELDEDSDIKKGFVSPIVKTFLVPFYLKMITSDNINLEEEKKFLFSNPLKIKKLLYDISSKSADEIKQLIKENNSIINLYIFSDPTKVESIYLKNLKSACVSGVDYDYLGSTSEYDLVISKSVKACFLANRSNTPYDESIPFETWASGLSSSSTCINNWCTGWSLTNTGYFKNYGSFYIDIIWKKNENGISHQIAIGSDGHVIEACSGYNHSEATYAYAWRSMDSFINSNNFPPFREAEKYPDNIYLKDLINIFKTNPKLVDALANYSATSAPQFSANPLLNLIFNELSKVHIKEESSLESYTYSAETIAEAKERGNEVLELIIPEGITYIPQGTFEKWLNLISIKFPTSLKKIGPRAFANCISLRKLNLNEGLETIEMGAFSGCVNLGGSIALPLSINKIEPFAFEGHSKRGLSFTLPTAFFNPELNKKLFVPIEPEDEKNWWFQKGRFKERM